MRDALRVAALAAIFAGGSSHAAASGTREHPLIQLGHASYYDDKLHGRRTASGEVLDQNAFTAASRTLPLGSYATVTNVENGRSVTVKINDRGPFTRGRIIDLSKRAAEELDIHRSGTARVRIEVIADDQPTDELRAVVSEFASAIRR
jgi:rare lipoprotein A